MRSYIIHATLGALLGLTIVLGVRPGLQALDNAAQALALATGAQP